MGHESDLELALELADLADGITMRRYRAADLSVETKPDMTPVTEADQATEVALRERITAAHPGDEILGEEFGADAGVGTAPLDSGPDRRNQELRPRSARRGRRSWRSRSTARSRSASCRCPRSAAGGGPAAVAARSPTGRRSTSHASPISRRLR